MKQLIFALVLAAPMATLAADKAPPAACVFSDTAKLKDHVENHVKYPATGKAIKAQCKKEMPDEFTKEERACAGTHLKDKTSYKTAAEVMTALGVTEG